jgi:hypothetical protein
MQKDIVAVGPILTGVVAHHVLYRIVIMVDERERDIVVQERRVAPG